MKKKNDGIKKGTLIIVLLVCIAAYLWVPEIHKTMNRIFKMFASGDFTVVRDFVASYGGYAALISFLLMIFQSIAAPLPAFFNYICQCQPVWMVERCDPFMEQRNGGSSNMLLYCKNIRT